MDEICHHTPQQYQGYDHYHVTVDFNYDFNRNKRVDAVDTLIARNSQTTAATALQLIDP